MINPATIYLLEYSFITTLSSTLAYYNVGRTSADGMLICPS